MAVQHYEELTGEEVDVEEGAIAAAFKKVAEEELKHLLSVRAVVQANRLPIADIVDDYQHTLDSILAAASDDCVRILAGEGNSFKEARDRMRHIRQAVSDEGLATLRRARIAVEEMWPALAAHGTNGELQSEADELRTLINEPSFVEQLERIASLARKICTTYQQEYTRLHAQRAQAYDHAIDEIKGRAEWNLIDDTLSADLLAPLSSRACKEGEELQKGGVALVGDLTLHCRFCNASLGQLNSDLAALGGLKAQVIARIQQMIAPQEKIERVKLSDFFTEALDSRESVRSAVERLHEELLKLLDEGVKIILE